jgi:prefoldin subunit 5
MADIRPKLDKLNQALSQGKQQLIDLTEFMQTCNSLFETCGECLDTGTPREKDDMLKDLINVQQTLDSDVESLAKEIGKNLEQMLVFVENPDNFSPDAWRIMQKTWREIQKMATRKPKRK